MGLCSSHSKAHRKFAEAPVPKPQTRESTAAPEDGSQSEPSEDEEAGTKSRWADVSTEFSSRINNLILHSTGNIKQFYDLQSEKLGEGGFGFVVEAKNFGTGNRYAVKKVSKAKAKQKRLEIRSEIDIMKLTDHPNVVKLHETFEDKSQMYLVMELCAGGDLDKHMKGQGGPYSEHQAAILMDQILKAVSYLHNCKSICHRDLKLQNFLFSRKAPVENNLLKLADFGLACGFEPGGVLATKAGTVSYCSPQVLGGVYDNSADLWSCGVIMYMLLAAQPPFPGKNDAEVVQRVRKGNYVFNDIAWSTVSEEAKSLVRRLLKYQPFDRATAVQARAHSWFHCAAPSLRCAVPVQPSVVSDVLRFSRMTTFQRAALRAVAMQLNQEAVDSCSRDFAALDYKGMSLLSLNDLEELSEMPDLEPFRHQLQEVVGILSSRPPDDSNISFNDFMGATLQQDQCQDGMLRAAFRIFDQDADGYISAQDIGRVFGRSSHGAGAEVVSAILAEASMGTSEPLRYQDFVTYVSRALNT
ncbi:CPK3 [Symbiodinium natans]|uniref:non-specific serine/threonine protein kinase n=1 Tax=Symbiodinium natans TaxID=878477 RepID=A0A812JAE1_9DINO|nr:CPK3 [Symbiodinium natans]